MLQGRVEIVLRGPSRTLKGRFKIVLRVEVRVRAKIRLVRIRLGLRSARWRCHGWRKGGRNGTVHASSNPDPDFGA